MIKHGGLILFLVLAQATTACNNAKTTTNTGTSAKQTIGAKGGSLTLGTGVSLQVPAGALDKDVEIGVEEVTGTVEGFTLGSKRYKFTPEGITFATPVTVSLEQSTPADSQSIFWTKAGGAAGYDKLATTACGKSTAGKDLFCGATSHFSEGFLGKENGPAPLTCATGQTKCGEVCADLQTSTANCGACGTVCSGDQVCGTGTCQAPTRTVTVTVQAYPTLVEARRATGPTRAVGTEISFVGRKVGNDWQPINVTTGADSDLRTYTFTTQALSYEVAVGCTITAGTPSYSVHQFKKSTVDSPAISAVCGNPPPPSKPLPGAPRNDITLQGRLTLASGATGPELSESGYVTTLDSGSCGALSEGVQNCDEILAPLTNFDVVYGNASQSTILRNVAPAPSGASALMPLDLPIAATVATLEAAVVIDLGSRTAGDFRPNVVRSNFYPISQLYFATSRGEFSNQIGPDMGASELAIESINDDTLTFSSSSVFAEATGTDSHTFRTRIAQNSKVDTNPFIDWTIDTTFRGAIANDTTRNVTLPASFLPEVNKENTPTGALSGIPAAPSSSVEATVQQNALTWNYHVDASAVPTDSDFPLSPADLSALIEDANEPYFEFVAENETSYKATVTYQTQDSVITATAPASDPMAKNPN
jgi:hypothetical protein